MPSYNAPRLLHAQWGLCGIAPLLFFFFCFIPIQLAHAQHLRLFACAIANDSTGAFMGGSSNGSGLYQSDDTGKTWEHLGWDNIKCYSMDEVKSTNGSVLYEATGLGILSSTDYGRRWKQTTDWRVSEVMDIAVNQDNPNEIYIATAHGPWRTEDAGKTWSLLANGLHAPFTSSVRFLANDTVFLTGWSARYWRREPDTTWHAAVGPRWNLSTTSPTMPFFKEESHVLFSKSPKSSLSGRQIWSLKSFLVTP